MSIADNLHDVQLKIATACAKVNRDPATVTLVAVSKKKPIEDILEAIDAGQQHFGENRVEESEDKIPKVAAQVDKPITWHMIGHIQSRKTKSTLPLFDILHSVDSVKLANKISRVAGAMNRSVKVFLECNVSGEEAKYGFNGYNWQHDNQVKDQLWRDIQTIVELPNIEVNGLMTMAPYVAEESVVRPIFANLFALRESLEQSFDIALPELSMGMTNDYEIAIEEGATIVRVGRAIFGERNYLL
jgi:pyridoxal phosphate enzyme (YggS family)